MRWRCQKAPQPLHTSPKLVTLKQKVEKWQIFEEKIVLGFGAEVCHRPLVHRPILNMRTHIDCRQMLSGQKNKLKCVEQGCVWSPLLPYYSRANWLDVNSLLWQTTTLTSIEGGIIIADFFSEAVSQRMALRRSGLIRGRLTDANYRAALFYKTSFLLTRYGFAC